MEKPKRKYLEIVEDIIKNSRNKELSAKLLEELTFYHHYKKLKSIEKIRNTIKGVKK